MALCSPSGRLIKRRSQCGTWQADDRLLPSSMTIGSVRCRFRPMVLCLPSGVRAGSQYGTWQADDGLLFFMERMAIRFRFHLMALCSPSGRLIKRRSQCGTCPEWTRSSGQVITDGEEETEEEVATGEEEETTDEEATPHVLTKVSGDRQGGQVGERLAKPFVVSVLDQNGSAFAGAVVTFSVTAGGGTLSATTAATDASGRARTTADAGQAIRGRTRLRPLSRDWRR